MSAHRDRVTVEGELGPHYACGFDGILELTVHSLTTLDIESPDAGTQPRTRPVFSRCVPSPRVGGQAEHGEKVHARGNGRA